MDRTPTDPAPSPAYEEVAHTADRALRIRGRDWPELFANAARGMTAIMSPDPPPATTAREITLEALDVEGLLVAWLSELAFWAESEALLFTEFEVLRLTGETLTAVVRGGPAMRLEHHIKAVTFHNLSITPEPGGWVTTVVFDV